jgi:hypothetical protein
VETFRRAPENEPPSFEDWSGLDVTRIYTRVERQIGGGRVPDGLDRVGKLTDTEEFNPFSALIIVPGGMEVPKREGRRLPDWMAGLYYRDMILKEGYDPATRWLRKQAGPHAARTLEKFESFVPRAAGLGITAEDLHIRFKETVRLQLSSADVTDCKFHSSPERSSSTIQNKIDCEIAQ